MYIWKSSNTWMDMKVCSEKLRLLEVYQKDKAVDITERNYRGSIQPSNVPKGGVKLCRNKCCD